MPFKPPLTKESLHAIKVRNTGSPDVGALLWEIARLWGTVLYADQLQRLLGTLSGPQGQVLDALRAILVDEPCVKEFPRLPPQPESGRRGQHPAPVKLPNISQVPTRTTSPVQAPPESINSAFRIPIVRQDHQVTTIMGLHTSNIPAACGRLIIFDLGQAFYRSQIRYSDQPPLKAAWRRPSQAASIGSVDRD